MTIISRNSEEFAAATAGGTSSQASGTLVQLSPADLATHWAEQLSEQVGFSIDSLLDMNLIDVEQRIDLELSKEGFKLEVVPLGTNYLSYEIMDNRAGEPVSFGPKYNGGFETTGQTQDFAYLDLFDDVNIGTRDFFIRYEGMIEVAPGQTNDEQSLFQFNTVGGFTLTIDGEVVKVAAPGEDGVVALDLAPGWHQIELLVEHDPLVATSPTSRTDDDLTIRFGSGRYEDGEKINSASMGDLFDSARTTPDQLIEVTANVTIAIGDFEGVFPQHFFVTSLDEIRGYVDAAVARLNPAPGASVSLEVTWSTEVSVEEADNYRIEGLDGAGETVLTLDDEAQTLADDGASATLRLEEGTHVVSVTQTFADTAAWDAADLGVTWSGKDTGGRAVSFPGDAPALTDGFFQGLNDVINSVGDWITESGALPLDLGPLVATPTLTFNLGIDAELGWNIELPGVGRTVTTIPATFTLNSTEEVEAGGTLTAWVTDLKFLAPTTRNYLLEMGSADFTAEFSLPETLLKDVGVFIGTSSVAEELIDEVFGADSGLARLNSALNDLVTFKLQLDKAVSLDEITGAVSDAAEASGARDPEKAFDLDGFIEGLYSGKVDLTQTLSDLVRMVSEGDFAGAFDLFYQVAGLGNDLPEPGPETGGDTGGDVPLGDLLQVVTAAGETVTLTPTEVLELAKAAALYAGKTPAAETPVEGTDPVDPAPAPAPTPAPQPGAIVSIVHSTLGTIRVTTAAVEDLLNSSGLPDAFAALNTLFTQGFEISPGLTVSGNLPIGEAFEHYGWDGQLDDDVAAEDEAREIPGPIVTETTVELLKVSADVREMYFGAALAAIDKQLEREDLTPAERKQLQNAKIAAAIQPLMLEILEEGASAELTLNQGPLLHALTDVFLGLIDDLTGGLNSMVDFFVPGDFDGISTDLVNNELINLAFEDPDQFEVLAREALQPVAEFMKTIPGFINDFIKEIGTAFVDVTPDTSKPPIPTEDYKAWLAQAVPLAYAQVYGIPAESIRVDTDRADGGWMAYDTRIEDIPFKRLTTIADGASVQAALEEGTGLTYDGAQPYGEWLAEVVPIWWELNRGVPRESVQVEFLGGNFSYAAFDTRESIPDFLRLVTIEDATQSNIQMSLGEGTGNYFDPQTQTYREWLEEVVPQWWELNGDLPRENQHIVFTNGGNGIGYTVYDMREESDELGAIDGRARAWEHLAELEQLSGLDFQGTTHVYPDKAELVGWMQTLLDVAAGVVGAVVSDDVIDGIASVLDGILYSVDVAVPDSIAAPEEFVADALGLLGFEFTRDADNYLVVDRTSGLFGLMKDAQTFPDEVRGFAETLTDFFVNGIDLNFDEAIDGLIDNLAGFVPSLIESLTARADLDMTLFHLEAMAALELTQRTTFDPAAVKIEYTWGDAVITADYGDAVQFEVPANFTGEVPAVEARLIFDGAYTYEYLLNPNFDVDFEMFGFSILGELLQGEDLIFSETFEYALIKTTEDIVEGDTLTRFDDALIEIDVRPIREAMTNLFDRLIGGPVRLALGDDTPRTGGTISLGTITGVDLLADLDGNTFTSVKGSNTITLLPSTRALLIEGDALANLLIGGIAADTLRGFEGDDTLIGAAGDDLLEGGAGNDLLRGAAGADQLNGGDGVDTVTYGSSAAGVTVSLLDGQAGQGGDAEGDTLTAIERLVGSAHADQLTGNAAANDLRGGDGADRIDGGAGNDLLRGAGGADQLIGGEGVDTATYGSSAVGVTVSLLEGQTGQRGDAEGDTLTGIERLVGSAHADRLTGNAAANVLRGGDGADRIDGGAGNDVLFGDAGLDRMTGGDGRDTFVFRSVADTGLGAADADVITDFTAGRGGDRLNLTAIDANGMLDGDQAFNFIGSAGFSMTGGELRLDTRRSSTFVLGDLDGDGAADFALRLTGTVALTTDNLLL